MAKTSAPSPYPCPDRRKTCHSLIALGGLIILLPLLTLGGCATDLTIAPQVDGERMVLVVGEAVVAITGERARKFEPEIRWLELQHQQAGARYRLEVEAQAKDFAWFLPPGTYEVTRVQISEGPFLSIAQVGSLFTIGEETVLYVGRWRFGVESPRYGRKVLISMVVENEGRAEAMRHIEARYPAFVGAAVSTTVPVPGEVETRLYEVLPYPRYPKYFQRHLW